MTERKRFLDAKQIEEAATGHWIYLFTLLTSIGNAADNFNGSGSRTGAASQRSPCPIHGGKSHKAFYFYNDADYSGRGGCNTCGLKTGLNLIAWANGWDYRRTLEKVADALDIEHSQRPIRTTRKPDTLVPTYVLTECDIAKNKKIDEAITLLWSESYPLSASKSRIGRLYLKNRGLSGVSIQSNALRFHPAAPLWIETKDKGKSYRFTGYHPCLLIQITDKDGKPTTLHRTFITRDGHKITETDAKKLMPAKVGVPISGSAASFFKSPPKNVIGIAEGAETSLAILKGLGMPMDCCINASMYANWEPKNGIEYAFLWKDKDKPDKRGICAGERVTKILKERLEKRGITVFVMEVPLNREGVDWLDAYNELGYAAFPDTAKNWADFL